MANKEKVKLFNAVAGNPPIGFESRDGFWEQVQMQARLALEEAQEQYDAAMAEDLIEVVDGAADLNFVQRYMEVLLESVGVMFAVAEDQVSINNLQKMSVNEGFVLQSQEELYTSKGVGTYIDEVNYEGQIYYVVKRKEDGKCLKLLRHAPPNISLTIPSSTMQMLGKQE